jgi:hypothetical protein
MKRCLYLVFILFFFTSCDQVVFNEPQPRKVKELIEIPPILQGTYLDQDGDTMYVDKGSFSYSSSEYGGLKNVFLSDSAVLKQYKDQYYYNASVMVMEERFWLSYIIYLRDGGSGFDLYAMDPDDIVKLAKLQEISSKIRDIEDGEQKYYLFDPKKKDYKKIISDTIFTKMISFERVGE